MSETSRVIVVGGGIVAASAAYHLGRMGASVVVVEGERVGSATAAGAGIICPWTNREDDPAYRLAADGARYYPELLAMLAEDGQDETGYARVGALWAAAGDGPLRVAAARLRRRQAESPEIGEVSVLAAGQPAELFPSLAPDLAAVRVGGAARIDGRSMRDSLLRAAAGRGARRITGVAALTVVSGRVTGVTVRSADDPAAGGAGGGPAGGAGRGAPDRIDADAVVLAAGAWTARICAEVGYDLAIRPQRGQIVHLDVPGADVTAWPVVMVPGDPYLLTFPRSRVVVGATREDAGFDYRVTAGGLGGLLGAALTVAPGLAGATVAETRVGFRPVTPDGLPYLGTLGGRLVVAAGNGSEGLTAGPLTGRAAAALALGERPPFDVAPFDPARAGRTS